MVLLIFPIIFYPAKTCNFDEMANISIFLCRDYKSCLQLFSTVILSPVRTVHLLTGRSCPEWLAYLRYAIHLWSGCFLMDAFSLEIRGAVV